MCPDLKNIPNKDPKFQAKKSLVSRCLKMLDDGEFDAKPDRRKLQFMKI